MSIQEILESAGLPAQRGVYTGRDKPDAYYTFLRLLGTPAVNAAGVYINSIDAESYETETGYWLVPITVEILKEE